MLDQTLLTLLRETSLSHVNAVPQSCQRAIQELLACDQLSHTPACSPNSVLLSHMSLMYPVKSDQHSCTSMSHCASQQMGDRCQECCHAQAVPLHHCFAS